MKKPKRTELPPVERPDIPEPVRKTPHCYGEGRTIPQGVKRLGATGWQGMHEDDSECQWCYSTGGKHSKACPRR